MCIDRGSKLTGKPETAGGRHIEVGSPNALFFKDQVIICSATVTLWHIGAGLKFASPACEAVIMQSRRRWLISSC